MTLSDALANLFSIKDCRITRRVWNNRLIYLTLDEHQRLCTTWKSENGTVDGFLHPWIMTESDYFADDWEVVE